jgi:hypothetical protein
MQTHATHKVLKAIQILPAMRQLTRAREALQSKIEDIVCALQATGGGRGLSDGGEKLRKQLAAAKNEMAQLEEERQRQLAVHAQQDKQAHHTNMESSRDVEQLSRAMQKVSMNHQQRVTVGHVVKIGDVAAASHSGIIKRPVSNVCTHSLDCGATGCQPASPALASPLSRSISEAQKLAGNKATEALRSDDPCKDRDALNPDKDLAAFLGKLTVAGPLPSAKQEALHSDSASKHGGSSHVGMAAPATAGPAGQVQMSNREKLFMERFQRRKELQDIRVCLLSISAHICWPALLHCFGLPGCFLALLCHVGLLETATPLCKILPEVYTWRLCIAMPPIHVRF